MIIKTNEAAMVNPCRDEAADGIEPEFGWKVRLDHVFREKRDQYFKPRWTQILPLLSFAIRYIVFWLKLWWEKKLPFIDGFRPLQVPQYYGVPLGGIGSGTIGRGFHGEFCRYHMIPGIYQHEIIHANQFIVSIRKKKKSVYQQVLSTYHPNASTFPHLTSWNWSYNGEFAHYHALYPQSWTTYELPGQNVTLICRQISPIIPHNYKDTSFPMGVFIWTVENHNSEPVDVSITFTFKNGIGCKESDLAGGCWTETFTKNEDGIFIKGVSIHQKFRETMPCSYNIAATETESVFVSHCLYFDPCGTGEELWLKLLSDGKLFSTNGKSEKTNKGSEIACAVSSFCTVQPNQKSKMDMCLSWDMPKINFRENNHSYIRRYTQWFGGQADAGPSLCHYALRNHHRWLEEINSWQSCVLNNDKLEDWYKSALFNELYYISDGGSLWLEMPKQESHKDLRDDYGRFAYLESHEYRMYNTYDVHFYASFALAMLWPKLQLSIQYDFADTVSQESSDDLFYLMDGKTSLRKSRNSIPHDLGDPEEEPWSKINGYQIHDVSDWKDLNVKFVLQVYRDYIITKDDQYLKDMWSKVLLVMEKTLSFDKDDDGVIENDGYADQTFDTWIMSGTSAYCGGLWLASMCATIQMANILKDEDSAKKYSATLEKGKISFDRKLWNGSYYKFDSGRGRHSNSIMSDQLCGHWYHKACRNDEPFLPQNKITQSLQTIFNFNVMKNSDGKKGAVNGMTPAGQVELFTLQSEETWIGVTYALAATLIHEGMWKEGMATAEGMYRTIYEDLGLGFQTPEAIYQKQHYRAPGYMRPLAIWGIQWAVENN